MALVVLCGGQLMISLDATVVNVALTTIQRDLHFSQTSLAWIVDAYLITFGGLLLLAGRFGDLIGPKKVFLTGMAMFTAASALCGASQTQWELIASRFLQGAGAAIVASTVLGILVTMFPEPREKGKALGIYAFVASGGSAIGLIVGGALTQALNWHWIFFINLPLGVAGLVLGTILIDEQEGSGIRDGVDVLGAVLVTLATMFLVYAIVKADDYGWTSARTIGIGVASIGTLAGFVWLESKVRKPIMPLYLFRSRNLSGATIVRMLFPVGGLGVLFLGALYLQKVRGYSPIGTGLAFMPMTLLIGVFSLVITSRIMGRIGAKSTLVPGAAIVAAGLLLLSRVSVHGSYATTVLPPLVLIGTGIGLAFTPSIALAMTDAAPSDTGLASGLTNVSIQLGSAIGIALLASVTGSRTAQLLQHGSSLNNALVGGYRIGFIVTAICLALALVIAVTVLRDPGVGRTARTNTATRTSEPEASAPIPNL